MTPYRLWQEVIREQHQQQQLTPASWRLPLATHSKKVQGLILKCCKFFFSFLRKKKTYLTVNFLHLMCRQRPADRDLVPEVAPRGSRSSQDDTSQMKRADFVELTVWAAQCCSGSQPSPRREMKVAGSFPTGGRGWGGGC